MQGNNQKKKRDAMTGKNSESSGNVKDSYFVKAPENHPRPKKTKRKQNRHLTVWDRRGERDKRSPENFGKNQISGAQVRPGQKFAGRC
jgi:hypothetical protein